MDSHFDISRLARSGPENPSKKPNPGLFTTKWILPPPKKSPIKKMAHRESTDFQGLLFQFNSVSVQPLMRTSDDSQTFYWKKWEQGIYPDLPAHSSKKLELLRDYLILYLEIVLRNASGKNEQHITLIDGFAGGGKYSNGETGSPLVILNAVREAEVRINLGRNKPIKIVPHCFFAEKNAAAFACLKFELEQSEFKDALGKTIHLRKCDFSTCVPEILKYITGRHTRGGNRTIFFLDQCGYGEVAAPIVKSIHQALGGRAEFIINVSISWFSDFLSRKSASAYETTLKSLGLDGHVDYKALIAQKEQLGGNWRHAVESYMGRGYHQATGINFFSPFYIEPHNNHRGYWLLHLAQNQAARAAMIEIHWKKSNRSKHYGPRGYGILSYKPDLDPTLYIDGMSFDDTSRQECQRVLAEDYANLIRTQHKDGIDYGSLANLTSNETVADRGMLNEVLWQLASGNAIEIESPTGQKKRSPSFLPGDVIKPKSQLMFEGFGIDKRPEKRSRRKVSAN